LCSIAWGETLEDAARALAQKVVTYLAPGEIAQVSSRNLTSLGAADAAKAQAAFERALRRRVRKPMPVPVTLTISENLKGLLLVAQVASAVEMVGFRPERPAAPARAAIAIDKKLLWEQDPPILDVAVMGDDMLVLDTDGVTHYAHRQRMDAKPAPVTVRDPRGRLRVDGDAVAVHLPGTTCTGVWRPVLVLGCEPGGIFAAGRNTLISGAYSETQIGSEYLAAEQDGRTHVYDAEKKPQAVFEEWGSDFTVVSACEKPRILAESNGSVALYDVVNHAPVRVSDSVELPGPVTALWPSLAVVKNLSTGRYEAYGLTVDCAR
jgi:hypothetical protein